MSGAVSPRHPHKAGSLIAAGVWTDLLQGAPSAGARHFVHPAMLADRKPVQVIAQTLSRRHDRVQPAPGRRPVSGLHRPFLGGFKVVARPRGEDQLPRRTPCAQRRRVGGGGSGVTVGRLSIRARTLPTST